MQTGDRHENTELQLRLAKALFNNGEFFRSYDIAQEGMNAWPNQPAFAPLAVLSLANAGALELALEKFAQYKLGARGSVESKTLMGRLLKEKGFLAEGVQRGALHGQALTAYREAYAQALTEGDLEAAYYSGINVAALELWCGNQRAASRLAGEVLALLDKLGGRSTTSQEQYWRTVTEAEARLIQGELTRVVELLESVSLSNHLHRVEMATTARQLGRIADTLRVSRDILRPLSIPAILHYAGHLIAPPGKPGRFLPSEEETVRTRIENLLAEEHVLTGYGSLAAGADILFAEALLARGAALHVTLPFSIEDFITFSVLPSGGEWLGRFHECLQKASSIRFATEEGYLHHDRLFHYASQLGMGLAMLASRHMNAPVLQAVVWDGVANQALAGTVSDMALWKQTGKRQRVVRCGPKETEDPLPSASPEAGVKDAVAGREICSMMFGDIQGFSRLTDRELPSFAQHVLEPLSKVLRHYAASTSFVNTWGDGVFVVMKDVCAAAECALTLQEHMAVLDFAAAGLPSSLRFRLACHLGPAYELFDPVLARANFYGAHVTRAARIEPITPEGCVYVTETFAAALALSGAPHLTCDYAGYTDTAKGHGRLRIFLLRRTTTDPGPAAICDIERPPLEVLSEVTTALTSKRA